MTYDVLVLGGGPGGYLAAERAGNAGLKVALFEKRALGGVCLNEGCVPSKAFLNSAKMYEHAVDGKKFGITVEGAKFDQKTVVRRKNKVVKKLVAGVGTTMKAAKVDVIEGFGEIVGREEGIITIRCNNEIYEGKNLILAAGSEAVIPPIPGLKEGLEAGRIVTNQEILDLTEIPERLVIVGGGVIGLEMGSYFQTVGSKVTVIEMLDHIAGNVDKDLGVLLQQNYEHAGMVFHLECKVTEFGNGYVKYEDKGEEKTVETDLTLVSIGRRAVKKGYGLENLNLFEENNRIVVDDQMRTNLPNVYAVGDVNGVWMLAHAAYREAEVAVNTILGKKDHMRYNAMPSVIYTNPELAYVGETEQSCKEKGINYKTVTTPMAYSGRYVAETERGDGICKLIVDTDHNRLIGCHLLGLYASELIISAGIMIETEMTVDEIQELVFPHPTVAEIIREAIFRL